MDASFARDPRWHRFGRAAAWLMPLFFGIVWAVFRFLSRDDRYATLAAVLLSAAALTGATLAVWTAWAPRLARRWQLNAVIGSWAVLPALAVTLIALARGVPATSAVALGVVAGVIAGLAYARRRPGLAALQRRFFLAVDTLSDAELVEAATRQPDDDPHVPAGQRTMERLNHARALIFLAMRNGDFDQLVSALPVLRETLQDRQVDPAVALIAGRDLVEAQSLLVQHGGDAGRYSESIELFAQLVRENPEIHGAQSLLHEHRAGYQQCVMATATQDLEAATLARDRSRAGQAYDRLCHSWRTIEQELRAALRLASGTVIVAEYLVLLGAHLCTSLDCLGEDRFDEGVGLCRRALSLRAGGTREQRPRSELFLAQCLVMRGEQYEDGRDLDEAEALLRRLARLENPVRARASELLLEIAVLRQGTRG